MASTPRESRRRKIVDRGSDRLALITGQINALPSEPSDNPSQPLNSYLSDQITVSRNGKDGVSDSTLRNHESTTFAAGHGVRTVEPSSRGFETRAEALLAPSAETISPSAETSSEIEPKSTSSTSGTEQNSKPRLQISSFVTANQITSAIAASEKSRLRCSVVFALLVVLSHLGFPLLGCNFIRSIISFRPLYLLLLTNITLVLAPLLLNNQRGSKRAAEARKEIPSTAGSDWTEQAGNALEVALVIQKVTDAAFMDCSVYAVIVICGLSLV